MTKNLSGALVRGAMWSVALRWGVRLMGLLSTLVIARLLTPADYGLIAMASLVMGLIETFLDADASTALLRSPNADPDFVNSAWTARLLQSLLVATVIGIAAPFASIYFEEPRLSAVLWAFCFITVGSGVGSLGPLLARRDLDFFLEVKVALFARIVGFFATVGLALLLRTYWALVFGAVVGMLAGLIASYTVHPFRPRLTLSHFREIFGFSQWMLVSGIGLFFARKLDGFVVGRVGTAGDLGIYNLALELGQMITMELGAPLNRALLPVLANLHEDRSRMQAVMMKTVAAVNTVTLPAGIGLALVAPLAVPALLGPQWTAAIPLLAIFSVIGAIRFMTGPYYTLLMTLGHSRLLAFMSWTELAAFAAAIAVFYTDGVTGIAEARVCSTLLIGLVWIVIGARFGLQPLALGRAVLRPVIGTGLMALALWALPPLALPTLLELAYRIVAGAAVYCAWIGLSWIAAGRPDGLEQIAVEQLDAIRRRTVQAFR